MNKATKQNKEADLARRWVRRDCLNEVMSVQPFPVSYYLTLAPSHRRATKRLKCYTFTTLCYSRINGADFWTAVDLFDRVMRSRRKVYRNALQEGDLKASLCGFGGVKWKYVCFFGWNLELILSSFEDRWSDSVLPCLLLLHCQVKWCKSTQIALKLRKNKGNDSR